MTLLGRYGRMAVTGVLAAMCSACATTAVAQADKPQKEGSTDEIRQTVFDSPDEAMKALMKATAAKDKQAIHAIFGPKVTELKSGDDVQDAHDFDNFARRLAKASRLVAEDDNKVILHLGLEDHPFPVPLVKANGKWSFDTQAGLEEMLNRRIGENEIKAAAVCRGCVAAQREYALADHNDDGVMEYAQHMRSTPGTQDGLYWETSGDEPPSPLGAMAAEARSEGYVKRTAKDGAGPRPYHGYLYRMLAKQGSHAPGGQFDYVINGHQVAGFAFIAYPVDWGSSGIMTFMVNANGKVLQKNLGEKTTEIAAKIDVYDPDETWTADQD